MDDLLLALSHLVNFLQPRRVWWDGNDGGEGDEGEGGEGNEGDGGEEGHEAHTYDQHRYLKQVVSDKIHLMSGERSLSYWRTRSGPPWE